MSGLVGNILVLTVLAVAVALAVRSMWRAHKSGGHCGGDCGSCGGCGGCQDW